MPTATDNAYVAADVPPPTAVPSDGSNLKSKWPIARDLAGSDKPCRLEGEVSDLVVLGNLPSNLSGIFYRIMCDPFVPPHPNNVPIDGDGILSAFLFQDGKVDFKMRYVETERYVLE